MAFGIRADLPICHNMSWEPDIARALKDNTVVRRWTRRAKAWAGHPVLEHHKWHFLALGLVLFIAVPWGLRAEEHALEDASVQALAEAGIPVADISFNGRNAVVTAPASSTDAIEATLSDVTGVRKVTVEDGTLPVFAGADVAPPVATPTTTVTPAPTTTTVPPEATLIIEVGGAVRMEGTLPDPIVVATLGKDAEFLYGGLVDNDLLVDSSLPEPVWLEAADDVLRLATWLSRGAIILEGNSVTVLGTAPDEGLAEALVAVLQAKLGADVPIDHEIVGADGPAPSFEIVADETSVELRGTVPNRSTMQRIATSLAAVREGAEVANETVLGEGTPSTYLTLRTPYMIRLLGTADQFTYRYEGDDIRGSVVGEAFFASNDADVTIAMNLLVEALAATLLANPDLVATIEIHSATADGDDANANLSQQRANATLLKLVRAGIDPERLEVAPGDGTGELLRFTLTTAEN